MFHLKSINRGKLLSIQIPFNKVFEIGYHVYEDDRFDASVSYVPEIEDRLSLSVSLFNLNFECNFFSPFRSKSVIEPQDSDNEINEVYDFKESNTDFEAEAAKYEINKKSETIAKNIKDELHEHGNVAVHHWVGIESGHSEPLGDVILKVGQIILIRSLGGSIYKLDLRCDDDGWYFYHPMGSGIIDIRFDEKRKLWVVNEPIE